MPVTVSVLQSRLSQNFKARQMTGAKSSDLALGIANGYVQFLPTLQVKTVDTGVLGGGTAVSGTIQLEPATGTTMIQSTLAAVGIQGTKSNDIASAVAISIANTMLQDAKLTVVVTGVSNGSGVGTLAPVNPAPLITSLQGAFKSVGMNGPKTSDFAVALGQGIANFLQTAVITTVDSGAPAPPGNPSAGSGIGTVS